MKIVFKQSFVISLENQIKFIALDKPTAAKKFKNDILIALKSILPNPYL